MKRSGITTESPKALRRHEKLVLGQDTHWSNQNKAKRRNQPAVESTNQHRFAPVAGCLFKPSHSHSGDVPTRSLRSSRFRTFNISFLPRQKNNRRHPDTDIACCVRCGRVSGFRSLLLLRGRAQGGGTRAVKSHDGFLSVPLLWFRIRQKVFHQAKRTTVRQRLSGLAPS